METLEENYNSLRKDTIDLFFEKLKKRIDDYNSESYEKHYYKNCVRTLLYDDFSISFKFLPFKFVLQFVFNPKNDTTITAYKELADNDNYPNSKLVCIPSLEFKISNTKNLKRYYFVTYEDQEYSLGDNHNDFIDLYIKKVESELFPG